MRFVIYCKDKPDSLELRKATREAHLAHVEAADVDIVIAGPLLDGETRIGSMFVVDADSAEAVHAFSESDPYRQAGLFGQVDIHPFHQVFPR